MSRSIAYLTSRVNFVQVSEEIPVTKQRNPDKVDPPEVIEGKLVSFSAFPLPTSLLPPSLPPILFLTRANSEQEGTGGRPHGQG